MEFIFKIQNKRFANRLFIDLGVLIQTNWNLNTQHEFLIKMGVSEAKKIVEMLANGISPTTGVSFRRVAGDPTVIRALFAVLKSIQIPKKSIEKKQEENLKKGRLKNAGLVWTKEQRDEISSLFGRGKTIKELSKHFERTEGAIKSELTHQGLIESRPLSHYDNRSFQAPPNHLNGKLLRRFPVVPIL